MIKLKHILTEKKELGGVLIKKISMATDRNHHQYGSKNISNGYEV